MRLEPNRAAQHAACGKYQRGFLLMTAVALIVVAALVLSAMVYLSAAGNQSAAHNANAKQAFYIAGTGLERGVRTLLSPTLTERLACGAITGDANLTDFAFGAGRFTVTAGNGGATYYPASVLKANIGATDSIIPLVSLSGYANAGRVLIDREAIDYSDVEPSNAAVCGGAANTPCLVGAQRGRDGTVAVPHVNGTPVGQYQCDLQSVAGVPDLVNARGKRILQEGVQLQEGWAVGANGVIFRWDGTAWSNVASPVAAQLNSVSMLSYADGWAMGNQSGGEVILHWTGGPNWTRVGPIGSIPNTNLNSVYCVSSTDCWAVGDQSGSEVILRWTGGPNWTRMTPSGSIPNTNLNSVYCVASTECWIVGDQSGGEVILHGTGSPVSWTRVGPTGSIPNTNLNSVYCVDSTECWIVGNDRAGGEVILHGTGSPVSWTRVGPTGSIPNTNLNSVYCVASNDCWAVGDQSGGEVILHWTGGPNWTRMGPSAAIPDVNLHSVYCVDSDDCWIAGDQSAGELLLHWDGTAWSRLPASAALPDQNLRGIYMIGSQELPRSAWREVFP